MTDYSKILFLPASAVQELELRVDHAHNPQSDLTDIEKSDALESLGIAKYYNGEYKAAIFYLECAISGPYGVMKAPRRLAYVNLLLGTLYYRIGDLLRSEGFFAIAVENCKRATTSSSSSLSINSSIQAAPHAAVTLTNSQTHELNNLQAMAMSNLAVAKFRAATAVTHVGQQQQGKVEVDEEGVRESIRLAREALDLAGKLHRKGTHQYQQHARVLVTIHLQQGALHKAEHVAEEHALPFIEKALLNAGVKFLQGNFRASASHLIAAVQREVTVTSSREHSPRPAAAAATATVGGGGGDGETGTDAAHISEKREWEEGGRETGVEVATMPRGESKGAVQLPPIDTGAKSPRSARSPRAGVSAAQSPRRSPRPLGSNANSPRPADRGKGAPPTKPTWLDELSREIMLAMISFNVDMLRASPEARFTEIDSSLLPDALTTMEDMIKQLQHRRQKNNLTFPKTHPEYEEDPYLSLGADQHPEFMAFDTYMYPVVTMSLLLSAAAERALLTAPFTTALAIESSNMDPSFDNGEGGMRELRTIEMKFRTALHAVEHCLPQQVLDATPYSLVAAAGPADEGASLLGSLGGSIGSGSVDGRAGGGRGGDSVVSELGAGEAAFNNSAQDDAAAAARGNPFQSSAVQAMGFANSPLLGVGVAVAGDSAVVTSASGAAARGGGGGVAAGTSTLSSTAPSEQDIPDISVLKDYAKNYTLVSALRGGEAEAKPISRNALQKLRQEFNIDLCPQTGLVGTIQLDSLESAKGVGGASDSSPAAGTSSKGKEKGKKGSKTTASKEDKPQDKSQDKSQEKSVGGGGGGGGGGEPSASLDLASNLTPSMEVGEVAEAVVPQGLQQGSMQSKDSGGGGAWGSGIVLQAFDGTQVHYEYKSSVHDRGTVRAEILPLLSHFGRDAASTWIEWALANCGGVSLGILSQPCLKPSEQAGLNWDMMEPSQPLPEFLAEVRNRLVEIDDHLTSTPTHGGRDAVALTAAGGKSERNIESRVLVYFLLTKLCAQLGKQKDAGHHLFQLERACEALVEQQGSSSDSIAYSALALRLRMDFEEWSVPQLVSDNWLLTHLVTKLLPLGKQYLQLAEQCGDAVLQRDALKRLINIYLDASQVPLAEDHDEQSQTLSQLLDADPSLVEEQEVSNPEWVQKNGKLRAKEFMRRLKAVGAAPFY